MRDSTFKQLTHKMLLTLFWSFYFVFFLYYIVHICPFREIGGVLGASFHTVEPK